MALLTKAWTIDFTLLAVFILLSGYWTYGTRTFTIAIYIFFAVYAFYQYKFLHWRRFGIAATSPRFPMGDVGSIFFKTAAEVSRQIYEKGRGEPFLGMWFLHRPSILLRDPELIKAVLVKDFALFHDRGIYVNLKSDPLSGHIFTAGGQKWRNLRAKMTPTFTSGKMKAMFPQFLQTAENLDGVLEPLAQSGQVIDVKEIAACYATDLVTLTAFGITTHALTDPDDLFRKMGKAILRPSFKTVFRSIMPQILPDVSAIIGVTQIPRSITKKFMRAMEDIAAFREKSKVKRADFMEIVCELKKIGQLSPIDGIKFIDPIKNEGHKFTMSELAAECSLFFVSGFETPAMIMSFALYELAQNQQLQQNTRQEIHQVLARHGGQVTYEAVHEMTYLDKVIYETLRMYAPVPILQRKSNAPYKMPNSEFVLPTGTQVWISVHGLHRDPDFYPDPNTFDPERFSEEAKAARHHYAYLPFGEGPRNCFGMRYTMMQKKIGMITMLNKYQFSIVKESPNPVQFDPESFVLVAKGGMKLKVSKLSKS